MLGDARVLWLTTIGIILVLALAALIFMISRRPPARRQKPCPGTPTPPARASPAGGVPGSADAPSPPQHP